MAENVDVLKPNLIDRYGRRPGTFDKPMRSSRFAAPQRPETSAKAFKIAQEMEHFEHGTL